MYMVLYKHPNNSVLETRMAILEGGVRAAATASDHAARWRSLTRLPRIVT